MAFDRSKRNCSLCAPARCTCDAKTYALEKAANRWAKAAAGEALPLDTTGRFLGGSHERKDRGDPQDHLARAHQGQQETLELRHYLEILTTRLEAMRNAGQVVVAEIPTLELQVRALTMHLEGQDLAAISRVLGHKSHSYASELLATIRAEAAALAPPQGSVAVPCACGEPACVVTGFARTGRPRMFKTPACRWRTLKRRRRVRSLEDTLEDTLEDKKLIFAQPPPPAAGRARDSSGFSPSEPPR